MSLIKLEVLTYQYLTILEKKHENRYVDTPDELQNDIETICDYIESIT